MTMNPEIKDLWTAALRSGDFAQGQSYLRRGNEYCCLGVLCELAGEAGVIEPYPGRYPPMSDPDHDSDERLPDLWEYGQGDEETLPGSVQAWAGITEKNPHVQVPGEILPRLSATARAQVRAANDARIMPEPATDNTITLAQLNDAGVPFTVIADIIDATL